MKWVKNLLIVSNIILVLITLMAWCSPYEAFQHILVIPILGLTYPALLMTHGIFVLLWGFLRSKWFILSMIMIALGQLLHPQVLKLWSPFHAETSKSIHVATFNAQFLIGNNKNALASKRIKQLLDVDILCLQESNSDTKRDILEHMSFPYTLDDSENTVTILSKYPILGTGQVGEPSNPVNVIKWADILIQSDTIRVFSAHLESNRITGEIPNKVIIVEEENINISAYFGILKHYAKFSKYRLKQAQEIQKHIASSPHPVIVCGDMNDSPMSRMYRVLSAKMKDTWYTGGFGFGRTFDTWVPGMRIDHVFVSEDWNVLNYSIAPVEFSDHHIVRTELELK